jgi:hypothetical protein
MENLFVNSREIFEKIRNGALPIGSKFDVFYFINDARGNIRNTGNNEELTFVIKRPNGPPPYKDTMVLFTEGFYIHNIKAGELGTKIERDPNTGIEKEFTFDISFSYVGEYQSDGKFHLVEVKRENIKSEVYRNYDKKLPFEYYNEGLMYLSGKGYLPQSREKAIESFRQGASMDHPLSKQKLAELGM